MKSIKTSIRHKLLLKKISENLGNGMSIGEAMRSVGYSKSYSESPNQIRETKSWDILVKTYLPEEELAKLHKEQLKAEKIQNIGRKPKIYPDNDARLKALDLGYKLHGKYKPEAHSVKFSGYSKEQLVDLIISKIQNR